MDPIETVHVIDDDEAVRHSIRFLLEAEGLSVACYAGADDFLTAPAAIAGCVLTDVRMPGLDGLELQAQLRRQDVCLPLIVMTGFGDVPAAVRAMKEGAVDFLEKPFAEGDLLRAVRRALERDRAARRAGAEVAAARKRIALLTPREREVLDLLAQGLSNKEMARILGTSPRTIDVHRARVFQKLEADNLAGLVRLVLAADAAAPAA
ncbi:response regulator transcription factor [Acidisoma sp. C75]